MLPNRMHRMDQDRDGRRNLPVWLVLTGIVVLLALAVFVWVALGMGSAPDSETVTVDVPLKL